MKKFLLVAVGFAAIAGSACSKEPECTSEMLANKAEEMTTALQETLAKNPAKAAELTTRVQEITKHYQGAATTSADACKAYDELIAAMKS